MSTARPPLFRLPMRPLKSHPRLSEQSRQQLRWRTHAGHAQKQLSPQPLKHMPRKTTKPGERQLRHQEKIAISEARQPRFTQPPQPVLAPTVQETAPSEAYFIRRTPTRNLPVYELTKRGGNLKQTRVRKIEGEGAQLLKQLEASLEPKPEWIKVNPVTGHVEMKGWYKSQIDQWLIAKGF